MSEKVLLLTPWMTPHKVITWQRAVILLFTNKIEVLEEYDWEICSPSISIKAPAVVRLTKPFGAVKRGVKFSRINVLTRDGFMCQYCGAKKKINELNYDHVVPRTQGGKTTWHNIVSTCYSCNERKGGRTPEQAEMKLLKVPVKPNSLPLTPPRLNLRGIPPQWVAYCQSMGTLDSEDKPIDSGELVA